MRPYKSHPPAACGWPYARLAGPRSSWAARGPIPVTIVAPAPGSAGSGSGQQGGFPALQLTDEQLQKLRESVAAGTKDGVSRALNNLTITQE